MRDLYKEAAEFGLKKAREELAMTEEDAMTEVVVAKAQYWTAWWAGRRASDALLDKAKELGLSDDQQEALRVVAAETAYD